MSYDILVTYPNGETELRAANSPAYADYGPHSRERRPDWTVSEVETIEESAEDATAQRVTLVFREGVEKGIYLASGRRGTMIETLAYFQDSRHRRANSDRLTPLVWCPEWGWRPCTVETMAQTIARLEREAKAVAADVRRFVYDIATNHDHDEDAHRYNTTCRMCEAEVLAHRIGLSVRSGA